MIAEVALSAVASLLILQSLFLLRVAMKTSEESSDMHVSNRREQIVIVDPAPPALNFSSQKTVAAK